MPRSRRGDEAPSDFFSPLQKEVLQAFFELAGARRFVLSGGTALAAYHLHHRTSVDLDLFTDDEAAFRDGPTLIEQAAEACGAAATRRRGGVSYAEYRLVRGDESLKVDVVLDQVPRVEEPLEFGDVRVDSLLEIAVNKVGAILHRGGRGGEPKDYADLFCILTLGNLSLDEILLQVSTKEAGFNPLQFASLLVVAKEFDYTGWRWIIEVRPGEIGERLVAEADRIFARYRPEEE